MILFCSHIPCRDVWIEIMTGSGGKPALLSHIPCRDVWIEMSSTGRDCRRLSSYISCRDVRILQTGLPYKKTIYLMQPVIIDPCPFFAFFSKKGHVFNASSGQILIKLFRAANFEDFGPASPQLLPLLHKKSSSFFTVNHGAGTEHRTTIILPIDIDNI